MHMGILALAVLGFIPTLIWAIKTFGHN